MVRAKLTKKSELFTNMPYFHGRQSGPPKQYRPSSMRWPFADLNCGRAGTAVPVHCFDLQHFVVVSPNAAPAQVAAEIIAGYRIQAFYDCVGAMVSGLSLSGTFDDPDITVEFY